MYLSNEKYDCENGHYHIKVNGEIDYTNARYIESNEYTAESYESIKSFFKQSEKLMLEADWYDD